jgi:hypothetical protein
MKTTKKYVTTLVVAAATGCSILLAPIAAATPAPAPAPGTHSSSATTKAQPPYDTGVDPLVPSDTGALPYVPSTRGMGTGRAF